MQCKRLPANLMKNEGGQKTPELKEYSQRSIANGEANV